MQVSRGSVPGTARSNSQTPNGKSTLATNKKKITMGTWNTCYANTWVQDQSLVPPHAWSMTLTSLCDTRTTNNFQLYHEWGMEASQQKSASRIGTTNRYASIMARKCDLWGACVSTSGNPGEHVNQNTYESTTKEALCSTTAKEVQLSVSYICKTAARYVDDTCLSKSQHQQKWRNGGWNKQVSACMKKSNSEHKSEKEVEHGDLG